MATRGRLGAARRRRRPGVACGVAHGRLGPVVVAGVLPGVERECNLAPRGSNLCTAEAVPATGPGSTGRLRRPVDAQPLHRVVAKDGQEGYVV